jgi:uncharacterized RDD family membrane protein YckC
MAAFVYEGVLLFGVITIAALAYALITGQRHALVGKFGLQLWLFFVIGLYSVWFWVRHGQTLAMRTWHLKVVAEHGQALGWGRGIARYLLSWMWFAPALLSIGLADVKGGWPITLILTAGVLAYAVLARLHPSRQFWHDVLCGTRVIDTRPRPAAAENAGR